MVNLTRARVLQGWGMAVLVVTAVAALFGAAPGLPTVALLLGLALAPAWVLFSAWPGRPAPLQADAAGGRRAPRT